MCRVLLFPAPHGTAAMMTRPLPIYTIERDSLQCGFCLRVSHNPHDVANTYCGNCHLFLPVVAAARGLVESGGTHDCGEWRTAIGACALCDRPLDPCPCGQPWQSERFDSLARAIVEWRVAKLGEFVTVGVGEQSWRVSRRCIAYHGITGQQLLSGQSGFIEVTTTGENI